MPIRVSADPWVLTADGWGPEYRGPYLGDGLLGQRLTHTGTGTAPGPGGWTTEPAYMAGLYDPAESIVPLPCVAPLRITAGNRAFGDDPNRAHRYRQELRLREGLLVTRAVWDTGAGEATLEIETALLRSRPGTALVRARVENRARLPVRISAPAPRLAGRSARIRLANGVAIAEASAEFPGGPVTYTCVLQAADRPELRPAAEPETLAFDLPPGQTGRFLLVTEVSGGPFLQPHAAARAFSPPGDAAEAWLEAHRAAWRRLWERDIEIEGDPEAQEVARACMFYVLCSVREENRGGVPPMGLSSNAFRGHVFWDMESWMLPALLPQHPELARAMLEYRFRTLDGARANAREEGLPGASFAWESGRTGRETLRTEVFRHGRHVTGDVALALRQYFTATGDRDWLRTRAWPILRETADNWAARARPHGSGWTIPRVTTPDENAGLVEHSAWTHHVARVNLEFAAQTARLLGRRPNPRWEQVARGLSFLRDPQTGVILAYRGFTAGSRAKQADALLLLFPGEAPLPREEQERLYAFYSPRVIAHGPAMTEAIHAIAAARLGRSEDALRHFRESYRPFVRPPFHLFSEKRTRDNLCFLTGAAGTLEALLYGFAGLRLDPDSAPADRPRLEPALPPGWTALRLRGLHWRGRVWNAECRPGTAPVWSPYLHTPRSIGSSKSRSRG